LIFCSQTLFLRIVWITSSWFFICCQVDEGEFCILINIRYNLKIKVGLHMQHMCYLVGGSTVFWQCMWCLPISKQQLPKQRWKHRGFSFYMGPLMSMFIRRCVTNGLLDFFLYILYSFLEIRASHLKFQSCHLFIDILILILFFYLYFLLLAVFVKFGFVFSLIL
jgi:hypothetical protein